jgi:hypothetical protein
MLPNDPQLALSQAKATMAARHRQAADERLVAPHRLVGGVRVDGARPDSSRGFRGLGARLRMALSGHGQILAAADDSGGPQLPDLESAHFERTRP